MHHSLNEVTQQMFRRSLFYTLIGLLSVTGPSVQSKENYAAYTYEGADGNRIVKVSTDLPDAQILDIALSAPAKWVVALPSRKGSVWVVALEDGQLEKIVVQSNTVVLQQLMDVKLPAGMPPVIRRNKNGQIEVMNQFMQGVSDHACCSVFGKDKDCLAYVAANGDLVTLDSQGTSSRFQINALFDSRVLVDKDSRLLVLTDPTDQYTHAALGDVIEPTSLTLLGSDPHVHIIRTILLPPGTVFEGLYPLWLDLDSDGEMEIVITLCNNSDGAGARIVVLNEYGAILSQGHLSPGGWRHQLAAIPMSENRSWQIADIQKPHVQKIVYFYEYALGDLKVVGSKAGYSSHMYASRNLDMARAGDFDSDGIIELLVPSAEHTHLHALSAIGNTVQDKWNLDIGGEIRSNLQTVTLKNGSTVLGIVNSNRQLRLWIPLP